MRIVGVEPVLYSKTHDRRGARWMDTWLFVRVTTDDGIFGIGEATNSPGGGNEVLVDAVRHVEETLIGEDASDITRLWHKVFRRFTFLSSSGLATSLLGGIDTALWDIKGKALGRPVYDLLGGRMRREVPVYANTWFRGCATAEDHAQAARGVVAAGYDALKFDPFNSVMAPYHSAVRGAVGLDAPSGFRDGGISPRDLSAGRDVFAAVRDAVGPDVEVLFDAHGQYNVATAVAIGRALAPYRPGWFEEPIPPDNVDALRRVRDAVDISISVGERLFSRFHFLPVLREQLADHVMPDVSWCGGVSELVRIANLAETHYVSISPHCVFGPVAAVATAHAMSAVPNVGRQELNTADLERYAALLGRPLAVEAGRLRVGDRPGLGVELDEDELERGRIANDST